jgi:hypothetical protein
MLSLRGTKPKPCNEIHNLNTFLNVIIDYLAKPVVRFPQSIII